MRVPTLKIFASLMILGIFPSSVIRAENVAPADPAVATDKKVDDKNDQSFWQGLQSLVVYKPLGITVGDFQDNPSLAGPAMGAAVSAYLGLRTLRFFPENSAARRGFWNNDMLNEAHLRNVKVDELLPSYNRMSPTWNPYTAYRRTSDERAYIAEKKDDCNAAASHLIASFTSRAALFGLAAGGTYAGWKYAASDPNQYFQDRMARTEEEKAKKQTAQHVAAALREEAPKQVAQNIKDQLPGAMKEGVELGLSKVPDMVKEQFTGNVKTEMRAQVPEAIRESRPEVIKRLESGEARTEMEKLTTAMLSVFRDGQTQSFLAVQIAKKMGRNSSEVLESLQRVFAVADGADLINIASLNVAIRRWKVSQDEGSAFQLNLNSFANPSGEMLKELTAASLRKFLVRAKLMQDTDSSLPIDERTLTNAAAKVTREINK